MAITSTRASDSAIHPGDEYFRGLDGKGAIQNPLTTRFILVSASGKTLAPCHAYIRPVDGGAGPRNLVFAWPTDPKGKLLPLTGMVVEDKAGHFAPLKLGATAKPGSGIAEIGDKNGKQPAPKNMSKQLSAAELDKKTDALLDQAMKSLLDGDNALAKVRLKIIVDEYPSTKAAPAAQKLLEKMMKK